MSTPGQRVDYVEESNPWSVFVLEDGTRIRCRPVVTSISYTGRNLPDGQPEYNFNLQVLFDQARPECAIRPFGLVKE